jgi:hypothetical protein
MTIEAIAGFVVRSAGMAYASFCFWMFAACLYREDDRDDRCSWAALLALFGYIAAPIYYVKRYRPMRSERLAKEASREADLQSLLNEYRK